MTSARAEVTPPDEPGASLEDPAALSAAALAAVGQDPRRALALADEALAAARRRDGAAATTALRAKGLAQRSIGALGEAHESLARAVRLAGRRGDRHSAAEARMTLAFVLLDLGRVRQALRAAAVAARDLEGLEGARLTAQHGLILQRCGRTHEARDLFDQTLPVFESHGDWLWEYNVRTNSGLLNARSGALTEAEADLHRAERVARAHSREVDASMALWNLGWVATRRGDAVEALSRFDRAGQVLDAHQFCVFQRLVDRAELLLSVGVTSEAGRLAERARDGLLSSGQAADLLECRVLLARIALLEGRSSVAAHETRLARSAAKAQARPGWGLIAAHLEVLALEAEGTQSSRLARRASALASALDDVGWRDTAAEARIAAARIHLAVGRRAQAAGLLQSMSPRRGSLPAAVKVQLWHAVALLRYSSGDLAGAGSANRAALAVLQRHRSSLGASDLQAHVRGLGGPVAALGLRLAMERNSATAVLAWLERWRSTDLHTGAVRPPPDLPLSRALERLRRVTYDLAGARMSLSASTRTLESQRLLAERDVVRLSRLVRPGPWNGGVSRVDRRALAGRLGEASLLEMAVMDEQLIAVTSAPQPSGRRLTVLHQLGPVNRIVTELAHLRFALGRLAHGRGTGRSLESALVSARTAAARLDSALLQPLLTALGDGPVILVPTGALHAIPWGAFPTIARRALHVVPSGTAWLRASATPLPDGPALFACGPGLAHAADEVAALSAAVPGSRLLTDAAATAEAVRSGLDGARVAHLATHGSFNEENPLLSGLQLADGPLMIYDLEQLVRPPGLVVLAACHSGVARVHPGDELLGVAHTFLSLGTSAVVATSMPTPDRETAILMQQLHAELRAGHGPAAALSRARDVLDLDTPGGYATAAGFAAYGA